MKRKKSCSNCLKGARIGINSDIFCRIKGVVSNDYICSKFRENPAPVCVVKQGNKCMDCEFFIMGLENREFAGFTGFCQLFTVRQFDGEQKNACSKFSKKTERSIS